MIQHLLHRLGLSSTTRYVEGTSLFLGEEVIVSSFILLLRLEENQLICCSCQRNLQLKASGNFLSLRIFFCQLLDLAPDITAIRALIIDDEWHQEEKEIKEKLKHILLRSGASYTQIDGDNWLVLPRNALFRHCAK